MADLLYDPAQEKEALYAAIRAVYKHWGTRHMDHACETLYQAVAYAEQA